MDIFNISRKEYFDLLKFDFHEINKRRNFTYKDVMPCDASLKYVLIVSEFDCKINGKLSPIKSFKELFQEFNVEKNETNFLEILNKKNQFIENYHSIGLGIKKSLINTSGSRFVYICCRPDIKTEHYWRISVEDFLIMEDLINGLPVNFGEFDIFDEFNNWFIKVFDDTPFVCLAAEEALVNKIYDAFENNCLIISDIDKLPML